MNEGRKPKHRNGRDGKGSWHYYISLGNDRLLIFKVGRNKAPFFAIMHKIAADGIALAVSLILFHISLTFRDEKFPPEPHLDCGLFIKEGIVLYLPNRYVLFNRRRPY